MTLGIIIILIAIFGSLSNYLNWKFLNTKIMKYLYYIGAAVHESSHAIMCLLTGAKIEEFKIISNEPHVTHTKSKLKIIGQVLISSAPVFGGIAFLFLIDYLLPSFNLDIINSTSNISEIILLPFSIISNLNIFSWESIVLILLFLNAGAMIGPSTQDLKNAWPIFIVLIFVNIPTLNNLFFTGLIIILANIYIQIIMIGVLKIFRFIIK